MRDILVLSILIIFGLLLLGWSLWIGVGLSLYWLSGIYSVKTFWRWDKEDGITPEELSYSDEWIFRILIILIGGLGLFFVVGEYINRKFKKHNKDKKSFKSWFE